MQGAVEKLSDEELREAVVEQFRRNQQGVARYLELVLELDSRPSAVPGARAGRAAQTFLHHRLHAPHPGMDVRAAHSVAEDLPLLGKALAVGDVSREHVDIAVRTLRRIPRHLLEEPGALAEVDTWFTDAARDLVPADVEKCARHLLERLDPGGERTYDPNAAERRELSVTTDWTGMVLVRGQLDPVNGASFKAAIDHFAAPQPTDPQTGVPDPRSKGQRQVDALGLLAKIALRRAGEGKAEVDRPKVVIHLPANESPQTGPLSPAWIARFACDSAVEAVSPEKLFLGKTVRTVTPAQRRFLTARDGGCVIPGCFTPPGWCDAHHVNWWSRGGPTDVTNMALVCGRHHTDIHSGIWSLTMIDGLPWARPPAWIDADRKPLRHTSTHHRHTADQLALTLNPARPPEPDEDLPRAG
jgi:hypothetical protein